MASLQTSIFSQWRSALPRFILPRLFLRTRPRSSALQLLPSLALASSPMAILSLLPLRIPSLLGNIWESILRAVPKKKQTHSRTRKRQLTGKALKDVSELVRCPACGNVKRAHILCLHCVKGRVSWRLSHRVVWGIRIDDIWVCRYSGDVERKG